MPIKFNVFCSLEPHQKIVKNVTVGLSSAKQNKASEFFSKLLEEVRKLFQIMGSHSFHGYEWDCIIWEPNFAFWLPPPRPSSARHKLTPFSPQIIPCTGISVRFQLLFHTAIGMHVIYHCAKFQVRAMRPSRVVCTNRGNTEKQRRASLTVTFCLRIRHRY